MGSYKRKSAKSAVSELPPVAAPQGRIVFRLRDERRKQGLSLDNVADALRIRKSYISAIENERFAELPGPTYALGFVGSYAQLLDLDRNAVVARFREEFAGIDTETELKFPMPLKDGRFPGLAFLAVSAVLAIAVYGAWFAYTNRSAITTVANTGQATSQPAAAKSVGAKPTGAKPKAAAKTSAAKQATSKADVAALLRHLSAAPGTKRDAVALNQPKSRPKLKKASRAARRKQAEAQRAKARKAKTAILAATVTPASGKARIVLKALRDTWVRIRMADGTIVLSRILKAGDSYAVLKNRGLVLTAGNAGGLRIIVDGRILPALGPKGAIRQGIRLDADELLASR